MKHVSIKYIQTKQHIAECNTLSIFKLHVLASLQPASSSHTNHLKEFCIYEESSPLHTEIITSVE